MIQHQWQATFVPLRRMPRITPNQPDRSRPFALFASTYTGCRTKLARVRLHRALVLCAAKHMRNCYGLSVPEKRREFVAAVDTSPENRFQEPPDHRRYARGLRFRRADRALRICVGANRAEGVLQRVLRSLQAVVQQANKRDAGIFRRIADGSSAAAGVPANHSFIREAYAGQCIHALRETQILRRRLYDVRSALRVQGFFFLAQEAREGLTIAAIAHSSIRGGWIAHPALDGAAPALQGMLHGSPTILEQ
jgi:hypothetical protein